MTTDLGRLGLAMRARQLVIGDALYTAIAHHHVFVVILAADASANTMKKVTDKCAFYEVKVVTTASKALLGHAIGKTDVAAIGITHRAMAQAWLND